MALKKPPQYHNINSRRNSMRKILVVVAAIIALATLSFAADMSDKPIVEKTAFVATLSGGEEVPAVMTDATGKAAFSLSKNGMSLRYSVKVKNIENVTAAHIHTGKMGQGGAPIALIKITASKAGKFSGTLAKGKITEQELMTSYKGKTLKDLIAAMKSGDTYINVHTTKYPDGEMRGQIMMK
jgi:hypothetical protein